MPARKQAPYTFVKNALPDKEFEKTSPSNFAQSLTLPQGVHAREVAEQTSCLFSDFEQKFSGGFLSKFLVKDSLFFTNICGQCIAYVSVGAVCDRPLLSFRRAQLA